jgi:hypothetical protein
MPLPFIYTRVLAVPRSMARSFDNQPSIEFKGENILKPFFYLSVIIYEYIYPEIWSSMLNSISP